ncbi:MAG: helix-turn-helix domain-containing protein [Myxococcaceae bacterium]
MKKTTRGTGNVFADIGVPDPEVALVKAQLASRIVDLIEARGLTQVQAAAILGTDQPRVSDIVRGSLQQFTADRLMRFITALGSDVEIAVHPGRRARGAGHLRVVGR